MAAEFDFLKAVGLPRLGSGKVSPLPFLPLAPRARYFAAVVLNQAISARLELLSLWSVEKVAGRRLASFSASYGERFLSATLNYYYAVKSKHDDGGIIDSIWRVLGPCLKAKYNHLEHTAIRHVFYLTPFT